jgi:hypothetical protein
MPSFPQSVVVCDTLYTIWTLIPQFLNLKTFMKG